VQTLDASVAERGGRCSVRGEAEDPPASSSRAAQK
jgi:hypothetical protein